MSDKGKHWGRIMREQVSIVREWVSQVLNHRASFDTEDRTTSGNKANAAEQALKKSCQNQLVIAAMMFQDHGNQRKQRMIDCCMATHLQWFEKQAHELRSVEASKAWLCKQLRGDFVQCLFDGLSSCMSEGDLAWVGVFMPMINSDQRLFGTDLVAKLEEEQILCIKWATLSMETSSLRMGRMAWMMYGWNALSVLWLPSDSQPTHVKPNVLAKFKAVSRAHKAALKSKEAGVQVLTKASQFNDVSVQQLELAIEDNDWNLIENFLHKKHSRLLSSQIAEDCFNRQKRSVAKYNNRRLNMVANFNVLLEKKVATSVHSYDAPPRAPGTNAKPLRSVDVFEGPVVGHTCDLTGVWSYKQSTSWYSPSSTNHPEQFLVDLLKTYCEKHKCMHQAKNHWLCTLIRVQHYIIIREKLGGQRFGKPLFAMSNKCGFVAFTWPAKEDHVPGRQYTLQPQVFYTFAPQPDCCADEESGLWVPILDLDKWQACSYEWRSPVWQHSNFTRAPWKTWEVRAFPTSSWMPIQQVAANNGFWTLTSTTMKKLATHLGHDMDDNEDEFTVCSAVVKKVLSCTDKTVVKALEKRVVALDAQEPESFDALMQADQTIGMFDKEDEESLKKSKEKATAKHSNNREFIKQYHKAMVEHGMFAPASNAKAKAVPKAKAKAALRPAPWPPLPPSFATLSQPQCARLCPPGGHLWLASSCGSWGCHYPPYKRKSFSWAMHTFDGAAKECLRLMWRYHLGDVALKSRCPIAGLFE